MSSAEKAKPLLREVSHQRAILYAPKSSSSLTEEAWMRDATRRREPMRSATGSSRQSFSNQRDFAASTMPSTLPPNLFFASQPSTVQDSQLTAVRESYEIEPIPMPYEIPTDPFYEDQMPLDSAFRHLDISGRPPPRPAAGPSNPSLPRSRHSSFTRPDTSNGAYSTPRSSNTQGKAQAGPLSYDLDRQSSHSRSQTSKTPHSRSLSQDMPPTPYERHKPERHVHFAEPESDSGKSAMRNDGPDGIPRDLPPLTPRSTGGPSVSGSSPSRTTTRTPDSRYASMRASTSNPSRMTGNAPRQDPYDRRYRTAASGYRPSDPLADCWTTPGPSRGFPQSRPLPGGPVFQRAFAQPVTHGLEY